MSPALVFKMHELTATQVSETALAALQSITERRLIPEIVSLPTGNKV